MMRFRHHNNVRAALVTVTGGGGRKPALVYLLSNDVGIVGSLRLEGAVVGPKVDRWRDAGNTSFVNLQNQR